AAVRDTGGGRVITTELDPVKAEQAARNFRASGLSEFIDLRIGDAFETLKSGLGGNIDLLLLDGWKEAYLPMLKFLEPRLSPGARRAALSRSMIGRGVPAGASSP